MMAAVLESGGRLAATTRSCDAHDLLVHDDLVLVEEAIELKVDQLGRHERHHNDDHVQRPCEQVDRKYLLMHMRLKCD